MTTILDHKQFLERIEEPKELFFLTGARYNGQHVHNRTWVRTGVKK